VERLGESESARFVFPRVSLSPRPRVSSFDRATWRATDFERRTILDRAVEWEVEAGKWVVLIIYGTPCDECGAFREFGFNAKARRTRRHGVKRRGLRLCIRLAVCFSVRELSAVKTTTDVLVSCKSARFVGIPPLPQQYSMKGVNKINPHFLVYM